MEEIKVHFYSLPWSTPKFYTIIIEEDITGPDLALKSIIGSDFNIGVPPREHENQMVVRMSKLLKNIEDEPIRVWISVLILKDQSM